MTVLSTSKNAAAVGSASTASATLDLGDRGSGLAGQLRAALQVRGSRGDLRPDLLLGGGGVTRPA